MELREQVHDLTRAVREVLMPQVVDLDLGALDRTFTLRANEGFVDAFAAGLVAAVGRAAPRARLRFTPKPDKDGLPLREGEVDLEIGVVGRSAPEVRTRFLFRDDFIGAVRAGHPLLAGPITPERYVDYAHVAASRRGAFAGPVDDALRELGLRREVMAVVPGFPDALRIARHTDLVAQVPRSCLGGGPTGHDLQGLAGFELPVRTPEIAISALWHPRMDADPAHRWLRDTVVTVCQAAAAQRGLG